MSLMISGQKYIKHNMKCNWSSSDAGVINLLCKPVCVTDASLSLMEEKTKQKDIIIFGL